MVDSMFLGLKARARKLEARQRSMVRQAIRDALAAGSWLGISDACIGPTGAASVAWAAFDPTGALRDEGSCVIELTEARSSTDAEAQGATLAALALSRLGAPKAMILCDCQPAVDRLMGKMGEQALGRQDYSAVSQGRYGVSWAARDMMGPANDAARARLGLKSEGAQARQWGPWMQAALGVSDASRAQPKASFPKPR